MHCFTWALLTLALVTVLPDFALTSCDFPESLQMARHDPPWYSQIMSDGSRNMEYYIRHNIMEIHYPNKAKRQNIRWKCTMALHGKLLLKRQDHLINSYYRCAKFVFRSKSVVQIMWSQESKVLDLDLCENGLLKLDPWPIISYESIGEDYKPLPFSGGYDMKIIDSEFGESGCNLMSRPMRLEAECIGGEGVHFDFISNECLPDRINMMVKQRTIPVTSWHDRWNHYVILKRVDKDNMWCLVMPVRGRDGKITAKLYGDLICRYNSEPSRSIPNDLKLYTLKLQTRQFPTLCDDEYDGCRDVPCGNFFKHECQKSCGVCNPQKPYSSCTFPRRFLGSWFQKDQTEYKHITMESSTFSIENVGDFQCIDFPDSPSRKSRAFTTVSIFKNGCRPRYTCIKFHRLAPNVLRYSLGHSIAWPGLEEDFGAAICDSQQFQTDPAPIDDMYRSYPGTGKPIMAQTPSPQSVSCNISSVLTISATLPSSHICSGTMFQHCEDKTRVRLEFGSCGDLVPAITDYRCLATYEGHYWERIVLLQSTMDDVDVKCVIFSTLPTYANIAYVMVASQCDQNSFNFAHVGLRQPMMSLKYRTETEACRSVPDNAASSSTTLSSQMQDAYGSLRDSGHRGSKNSTFGRTGSGEVSVPFYVTVSVDGKSVVKPGTYNDEKNEAVSPEGNEHLRRTAGGDGNVAAAIVYCGFVNSLLLIFLTLSMIT